MLPSMPRSCPLAATLILPAPGLTLQLAALSSTVQEPPRLAVPQPFVTVRLQVSEAIKVLALDGVSVNMPRAIAASNRTILAMAPDTRSLFPRIFLAMNKP